MTPLTYDQRLGATTMLDIVRDVGGRPVVSHAGGTHVHAVLPNATEYERLKNLPHCRRAQQRRRTDRRAKGTGDHDLWREASIRDLATLALCGSCRRRIEWMMET